MKWKDKPHNVSQQKDDFLKKEAARIAEIERLASKTREQIKNGIQKTL
jgi:hypothetical protein